MIQEGYPITDNTVLPINRYNAAGGVVIWKSKVLVLFRKLRNDFRLPKGHIEPAETPLVAAIREIGEESGYVDLHLRADLGAEVIDFERSGRRIIRNEHYFVLEVLGEPRQIAHEDDRDPLWVGWDEALNLLTFEAEREWVRRARAVSGG